MDYFLFECYEKIIDKQTAILSTQLTQNICITFIQCWTNVEDVGPTLYKCYTNVLCLLGRMSCYIMLYTALVITLYSTLLKWRIKKSA